MDRPRYSFVIPVYNEQESLRELFARLRKVLDQLDGESEVILVDDGSTDGSYPTLVELHDADHRFKVVRLTRNFGHQVALTAGLDFALGDAVVIMDADLQDPPELVPELAKRWQEGYEVVHAVRKERAADSWLKRVTAAAYYRVLDRLADVRLPLDVGDFRLVDRRALEAFRTLRERHRYVRGLFAWLGFKQTGVEYARPPRFAGETKYPFRKSLRLAVDGIVSFSHVPLRLSLALGFVIAAISFAVGVFAIVAKLAGVYTAPGWASIVVAVSLLAGVQLIVMGMMGLYIARIYDEVKARPLYLVHETVGVTAEASRMAPTGHAFTFPP